MRINVKKEVEIAKRFRDLYFYTEEIIAKLPRTLRGPQRPPMKNLNLRKRGALRLSKGA
jgi:hypothetical protein